MNANVVLPQRAPSTPWTGSERVAWSALLPGDVVLGRSGSCGACQVLAVMTIRERTYLSFYCCGGQYLLDGDTPVASPRLRVGIDDPKVFHQDCVCAL